MTSTQTLEGINVYDPIAATGIDLPDYESAITYIAAESERKASSEGQRNKLAGEMWERLVAEFLRTDPVYRNSFAKVELWGDYSSSPDIGTDIVCETFSGQKIAVQCKFSGDPSRALQKGAIDSFIATTDTKDWHSRFVFWSGFSVSPHIDSQICEDRAVPLKLVTGSVLRTTNTCWAELATTGRGSLRPLKKVRGYQQEAVEELLDEFAEQDRAQLIMACGSGKTYTSQLAAEKIAGADRLVLYVVPSIALMGQTMREWAQEEDFEGRGVKHSFLGVCSDAGVGKDVKDDGMGGMHKTDIAQLEMPVGTNPEEIAELLRTPISDGYMRTVFSTYQSLPKIKAAQQRLGAPGFDLILCDEAHRTTGLGKENSDTGYFQLPHHEIEAEKRVYMTATPKVFSESATGKAKSAGRAIWTMGDEDVYGKEAFKLSFSKAISKDVLADYKVHIIQVAENVSQEIVNEFMKLAEEQGITKSERNAMLKTDVAARLVGLWQALTGDKGIRTNTLWKSIVYLDTIKNSRAFAAVFPMMCDYLKRISGRDCPDIQVQHVDGGMSATVRQQHLSWLDSAKLEGKIRVLSNAKCLSEGVDVPSLDGVGFLVPKGSIVDIVQSVGRVMRIAPLKRYGHVILPAVLPMEIKKGYSNYLKTDSHWKTTWQVLRALRSHDDKFANELAIMELYEGQWPERIVLSVTDDVDSLESICFAGGGTGERQSGEGSDSGKKSARDSSSDSGSDSEPSKEWGDPRDPDSPAAEWLKNKGKSAAAPHTAAKAGEQQILNFAEMLKQYPAEVLKMLQENIAVTVLEKVGDRQYWDTWSKDAASAYRNVLGRLETYRAKNEEFAAEIANTAAALEVTLGALGTDQETMCTLAQFIVVRPVFEALFGTAQYFEDSPLSQAMCNLADTVAILDLDSETSDLSEFYKHVAEKAKMISSPEDKQSLIKRLYEDFIRTVFPDEAKKYGVVYTPNEIVDFILRSVDHALKTHLDIEDGIASENVEVLDPFAGTGTFLVNLIQNPELMPDSKLEHKFLNNLHTTEIMALPYWATELNMEQAYMSRTGQYQPYERGLLADTFHMGKKQMAKQSKKPQQQKLQTEILKDNITRATQQDEKKITCIVSNPPWAVEDTGEWENLEQRVRETFASKVDITNKNTLQDSYILALRWATDRIGDKGVIGFVTNNSWLNSNVGAGIRRTFEEEFDHIYVLNLRGKGGAGVPPEQRIMEGDNLFNVTVGNQVVILVKTGEKKRDGKTPVVYADMLGLSFEEKRRRLMSTVCVGDNSGGLNWEEMTSDYRGDWIEQGNIDWQSFLDIGNSKTKNNKKDTAIFRLYSSGLKTGMDSNSISSCPAELFDRAKALSDKFNYLVLTDGQPSNGDPPGSNWHNDLVLKLERAQRKGGEAELIEISESNIFQIMASPWVPQHVFWHKTFNSRQYRLSDIYDISQSLVHTDPEDKQTTPTAGGGWLQANGYRCHRERRVPQRRSLFPLSVRPQLSRRRNSVVPQI